MSERAEIRGVTNHNQSSADLRFGRLRRYELIDYRRDFAGHIEQPQDLQGPSRGTVPLKVAMEWSK